MNPFLQSFVGAMPDDMIDKIMITAVTSLASAKLDKKRNEGRGGWHTPSCSIVDLHRLLQEHVAKGDMIDVVNLAGMIHIRQNLFGEQLPTPAVRVAARPIGTLLSSLSDGTVIDELNGLQWQAKGHRHRLSFKEAERHCKELDLAGHKDWRLPTEEELLSLVDRKRYSPAINPELFPETESAFYWSSTPYASNPADFAWGVGFYSGGTDFDNRVNDGFVRAVRSVAPAAPGQ